MTEEEQKRIFGKNLSKYVYESGKEQKQIAKELGFAPTTFNTWCVGKIIPRAGKIQILADYFHIKKTDLLDEFKIENSEYVLKVPILGRVAAGIPIEAIENVIDYEEIPKEMAMNGEYFGLRIKGDSMMPTIRDGDTVIVRKQDDAETDQIVIAMVNGNDATCKRLMKYDGGISLISFNPAYPPMMFSNDQIEKLPVKIIGRVVENRQKF